MDDQRLTIKEIADLLEVSSTTVSRVLNGQARKYRISEKTEIMVRETAAKYNWQPNQLARSLRLRRTNTIGLLIPDISNPFFANLARMAETALRQQGKMILLCNTNDDTELEKQTLDLITGRRVDGLLVAPVGLKAGHFKDFKEIPLVFIDRYFGDLSIPHVSTDNEAGGYRATRYLLDRGHRRIACIQGLVDTVSNQDRVNGFRRAMREAGVPGEKIEVLGDGFNMENGYRSGLNLLQRKRPPTAVFTLSNQIAVGALRAARELGKRVPDDLSLITFDEQPYFELTNPPITTMKQPIDRIGAEAVRMLSDLMAGKSVNNLLLPPELIERESVSTVSTVSR